jgi:hypothetical protein
MWLAAACRPTSPGAQDTDNDAGADGDDAIGNFASAFDSAFMAASRLLCCQRLSKHSRACSNRRCNNFSLLVLLLVVVLLKPSTNPCVVAEL